MSQFTRAIVCTLVRAHTNDADVAVLSDTWSKDAGVRLDSDSNCRKLSFSNPLRIEEMKVDFTYSIVSTTDEIMYAAKRSVHIRHR